MLWGPAPVLIAAVSSTENRPLSSSDAISPACGPVEPPCHQGNRLERQSAAQEPQLLLLLLLLVLLLLHFYTPHSGV